MRIQNITRIEGMHLNNLPRITELRSDQNGGYIKEMILLILNEQKVSLSQARGIFEDILNQIEDKNIINL